MLLRPFSKLLAFLGPILILGYIFYSFFDEDVEAVQHVSQWLKTQGAQDANSQASSANIAGDSSTLQPMPSPQENGALVEGIRIEVPPPPPQEPLPPLPAGQTQHDSVFNPAIYHEIASATSADGKYFPIVFGRDVEVLNPNILPHPSRPDTWIVVAQREKSLYLDGVFEQVVCNAAFRPSDGALICVDPVATLPISPTRDAGGCTGSLAYFSMNIGPHDMRVMYGPDGPYGIWGSQSKHTCFGMWAQDFRTLWPVEFPTQTLAVGLFATGTELQRPEPWGAVEKNWFLFWDGAGAPYVHHDVAPRRIFAQLSADGSVGPDLGPGAGDDACLAALMPRPGETLEDLHQASNSLSITMCQRADPACLPTDDNTFVLTIFQHKTFHEWHGVYAPYAMLFRQSAPFSMHAVSQKPLWIKGRGALTAESHSHKWEKLGKLPEGHSEMFYVTSIAWKQQGNKYHGFLDDVLMLGFGIEDSRAGGIDVRASDLLQNLGSCKDVAAAAK